MNTNLCKVPFWPQGQFCWKLERVLKRLPVVRAKLLFHVILFMAISLAVSMRNHFFTLQGMVGIFFMELIPGILSSHGHKGEGN